MNSPSPNLITPETEMKIKLWREKAAAGTLTMDEMKEAIIILRAGRLAASEAASKTASTGGKSRAKKTPVDAQALLDGI